MFSLLSFFDKPAGIDAFVQGLSAAGGEGPEIKVKSNNSDADPMAYLPHVCIVVK